MCRTATDERSAFSLAAGAWMGEIVNAEPDTCDDLAERLIDYPPANTVPGVRYALGAYRRGL
jgi:hypothetical protein